MDNFRIKGPNFSGVNPLGGTAKQRQEAAQGFNPLSSTSGDSVHISSSARLGTPAQPKHSVDFGAIAGLSLDKARAQLHGTTNFGIGLF